MDPDADARLEADLAAHTRFQRLVHVVRCASTQDLAASELAGDLVVWADEQRAGRGRQGRVWSGAAGLDVEVTFRVDGARLPVPSRVASALPAALVAGLEEVAGRRLTLKWPNDVLVDGRKLAGVLLDFTAPVRGTYLVGVGVNVNRTGFPPELREVAGSLALATGRRFDRHTVVAALGRAVDRGFRALLDGELDELAEVFRTRTGWIGRRLRLEVSNAPARVGPCTDVDLDRVVLGDGVHVALANVARLGFE